MKNLVRKMPPNLRLAISQYAKRLDQLKADERLLLAVMQAPPEDTTIQHYETAKELLEEVRQETAEFVRDFARLWLTKKGRK